MKETCWDDCIESMSSVKISPDSAKSKSLVETAKGWILILQNQLLPMLKS